MSAEEKPFQATYAGGRSCYAIPRTEEDIAKGIERFMMCNHRDCPDSWREIEREWKPIPKELDE